MSKTYCENVKVSRIKQIRDFVRRNDSGLIYDLTLPAAKELLEEIDEMMHDYFNRIQREISEKEFFNDKRRV